MSSNSSGRPPIPQSRSYAFGSSTPRDFSYIANAVDKRKHSEKSKNSESDSTKKDIRYYMRLAKSSDGRFGQGQKGAARNYAFGSSTPRSLSHLNNIAKEQRVYDAKLEKGIAIRPGSRSVTNPQLVGTNQNRSISQDDDAASEPDIVQDRQISGWSSKSAPKKESVVERERGRPRSKQSTAMQKGKQSKAEREETDFQREKAGELAVEVTQNHTAVSSEVKMEMDENGENVKVKMPDVETERADFVQVEDREMEGKLEER